MGSGPRRALCLIYVSYAVLQGKGLCPKALFRGRVLPSPLVSFLAKPGRVLLVKGHAGAGKTHLALHVARWYQLEHGDALWVSTRDSGPDEEADLENVVEDERRIDLAERIARTPGPAPAARLDEALHMLEDVLTQARASHEPLVIVDSLTALAAELDPADRQDFTLTCIRTARDARLRLIAILETDDRTEEDYLADGVVRLTTDETPVGRMRTLRLEKLRGTPIARVEHAFTLAEGEFWWASPAGSRAIPQQLRPPAIPDVMGRVSTGTTDWDALQQGGFARGSSILIEVAGAGVSAAPLTHPLLLNSLNLGRPTAVLTGINEPRHRVASLLDLHVGRRTSPLPLAIVEGGELLAPSKFGEDATGPDDDLTPLELARRQAIGSDPFLSILDVHSLLVAYDRPRAERWLARWTHETRKRGEIDVLVCHAGEASDILPMSDDHWIIRQHHGLHVLRGIQPSTESFFIRHHYDRGYPQTELRSIQ